MFSSECIELWGKDISILPPVFIAFGYLNTIIPMLAVCWLLYSWLNAFHNTTVNCYYVRYIFSRFQEDKPILPSKEEKDSARTKDYQSLLTCQCRDTIYLIPDPLEIKSGWISEQAHRLHVEIMISYVIWPEQIVKEYRLQI